jgi:hypothetical protein
MLSAPKFRIWSKNERKMFYPNWIRFFSGGTFEASCGKDLAKVRHIPSEYTKGEVFTVMDSCSYYEVQVCTNNKDKNGIYESINKMHSWNSISSPILFRI